MIERLLAAERALEAGDLERADRLFGQVADADSRNAIAVTGLAEVAPEAAVERAAGDAAAGARVRPERFVGPHRCQVLADDGEPASDG